MADSGRALAQVLERIAARFGIADVYVFGSRAAEIAARVRGDPALTEVADSDIDIAVQPLPDRLLGARERVRLAAELEDAIGAHRVDLVVLTEATPYLALDIIRGELLLTTDPYAQAEHELYILRRAVDLAPHERERRRLIECAKLHPEAVDESL